MRDFLSIFLMFMFFVFGIDNPGFCGVGNFDDRIYVQDWSQNPYNKFVRLKPQGYIFNNQSGSVTIRYEICTAQYIAPNLILSAGHCVKDWANNYMAENYKDEKFSVELLEGHDVDMGELGDWAIFKVKDKEYYSNNFFDLKVPEQTTSVLNAGFGSVRILTSAELDKIRDLSTNIKNLDAEQYMERLKELMRKHDMQELKDSEYRLKSSECEIVFENRKNLPRERKFPDILATTCDSWNGNSGGGYVSINQNFLYGVCSYGTSGYNSFNNNNAEYLTSTKQFIDKAESFKKQYPINSETVTTQTNPAIQISPKTIEKSGPSVEDMKSVILSTELPKIETGPRINTEILKAVNPGIKMALEHPTKEQNIIEAEITTTNEPNKTEIPRANFNFDFDDDYEDIPENVEDFPALEQAQTDTNATPAATTTTQGYIVTTDGKTLPTQLNLTTPGTYNLDVAKRTGLDVLNSTSNQKDVSDNVKKIDNAIVAIRQEVAEIKTELQPQIVNIPTLNNNDLMRVLDKIVTYDIKTEQLEELEKLKKEYENAKSREQSKENRLLTAATVAATGIGGMELAQGLSEQRADKDAEQNMAAYISTMRCEYGNGKSIKASAEEIELPGGNDGNLMKYRNEYFTLANDLKTRKEALGMKPGIESEEILDKSQMGLYDDENIGITDGTYASLYRAQMLDSEKDKQEIEATKQTSKNRVIGGSAAAGVGTVGGVVGDFLINNKTKQE